jgi:hypothetical protein
MILTPIYEAEFLGFSYGFSPGGASTMRWTRSRTGSKDATSMESQRRHPVVLRHDQSCMADPLHR